MVYRGKLLVATVLIGTGFAVIMAVIAHELAYNIAPVMLGWVFGVFAMGTVVRCDNYLSSHALSEALRKRHDPRDDSMYMMAVE